MVPALMNGTFVVLGLVDVLDIVLGEDTNDGEVVLVFWPNGINLDALVVPRAASVNSTSVRMLLVGIGEISGTVVVFVLVPKGIPTELAIASGGFTFYFNKIECISLEIYLKT